MAVEWTSENDLVAQVGETFAHAVLKNMPGGSTVRFGETGDGTRPNYQVDAADGAAVLYRGTSHNVWKDAVEKFNASNISPPFSRDAIFAAFVQQYRKPRVRK